MLHLMLLAWPSTGGKCLHMTPLSKNWTSQSKYNTVMNTMSPLTEPRTRGWQEDLLCFSSLQNTHSSFPVRSLSLSYPPTPAKVNTNSLIWVSFSLVYSVCFFYCCFFFCRISTSKVQYCSGHLEKNPVWIYCCKFSLNVSLSLSLRLNSARGRVCVLQVCRFDSARIQITQTNRPDPFNGINVFSHKSCWCLSHPSQTLHLKPSRCIGDLLWGCLKQRVLN